MKEWEILQKIKDDYPNILKNKLVGIYVHGSIAFGCFNWGKSDIDFLVVVNEALDQEEKEALILELLKLESSSNAHFFSGAISRKAPFKAGSGFRITEQELKSV